MAGPRKKKFQSGEGAEYWSRNRALKRLQLSLKDFRKLCILKGIYPREPKNRKKAQQGDTTIKTLYAKKDIQFLMHEPIIWKLRERKTHGKRINRAKSLRDFKEYKKLMGIIPQVKLDHIVKERYPTFVSALRDLDDCLTMCFLFSTFPLVKPIPRDHPAVCRRLTFEFLHAIITTKALRKVFVSIKGYYFQAEIKGQTITWIMPHHFAYEPQRKEEVDFKIMATFVEFYTVLLGFVNFKLYNNLNFFYPPKVASSEKRTAEMVEKESYTAERIAALTIPLVRTAASQDEEEDDIEIDVFDDVTDEAAIMKAKLEQENVKKLKSLFKGLRVFLSREVPRLPLAFTLLSLGAEVSWDEDLFVGSTFKETDETITHQITDRPLISKQYISRYYVQPQWVFDSVNARRLLPVEKYFVGVELPPHLSPFVDAGEYGQENYIPPEQLELLNPDDSAVEKVIEVETPPTTNVKKQLKKAKKALEKKEDAEKGSVVEEVSKTEEVVPETTEEKLERMKKRMTVLTGKAVRTDINAIKKAEMDEFQLRERMVPSKYRNLYRSMMKGKAARKKDKNVLQNKRQIIEKEKKNKTAV